MSRNSLFGVTNVQTFIYFQTQRGTGVTFYKLVVCPYCLLVSSVLDVMSGYLALVGIPYNYRARWDCTLPQTFRIFDALHLALIVHAIYYYLVGNYANIAVLQEIVWSAKVSSYFGPPCCNYHVDGLVQLQIVVDVSMCFLSSVIIPRHVLHRFSSSGGYICKFDVHYVMQHV